MGDDDSTGDVSSNSEGALEPDGGSRPENLPEVSNGDSPVAMVTRPKIDEKGQGAVQGDLDYSCF